MLLSYLQVIALDTSSVYDANVITGWLLSLYLVIIAWAQENLEVSLSVGNLVAKDT